MRGAGGFKTAQVACQMLVRRRILQRALQSP
jgi:hypothetical protein